MSRTLVLGVETSCDETAAAVVSDGREVLSNIIASQTDIHRPFGGVVPEIAARRHIEVISRIVDKALSEAGVAQEELNAVAAASGPGLAGALLVGVSYAKALAYALDIPIVGVHHIEGHVCANYLGGSLEPPFLALVVSGGHTLLLAVRGYDRYETLGRTRDDAAGEAFDKAARAFGLEYPGGPVIDKLAARGDPGAARFPRAKLSGNPLDFSFSGLKTAARQLMEKSGGAYAIEDIAASFQKAVVDVLVDNTMLAAKQHGFKDIALAGGVASNNGLRSAMRAACERGGYNLHMPEPVYCTDNAAMAASRGYYALIGGQTHGLNLNAVPNREPGA